MEYLDSTQDNLWGLDIEANGLTPTKIWVVCLVNLKTNEELHFTEKKPFNEWLKNNTSVSFITHNGLKADIPWLNALWSSKIDYSRVVDTFVLSQLFDPNLPKPDGLASSSGTHSLEAWGCRVKDPKGDFNDWSKYSEDMLKYCYQDVKLTLKVYKQLAKKLKTAGFSEQSVALEHAVAPIIGKQQRDGCYFDKLGAERLVSDLRDRQAKLGEEIQRVFPPVEYHRAKYKRGLLKDGTHSAGFLRHSEKFHRVELQSDGSYDVYDFKSFNIGSPTQRIEKLLGLGYVPTSFTKTGQPKVDEDALVQFAEASGVKEIQYIADWIVLEGRSNMVEKWLEELQPDGCIHGNVFTCGAQSRRMRHTQPNTANIPRVKTKYGKEVRALWQARPGRAFVGADASSLEGRMFYHHLCKYVSDEETRKFVYSIVVDGSPHKINAKALTDAGMPCSYEDAKTLYYAFLYGALDPKLGSILKGLGDLGAKIRAILIKTVPGLQQLLDGIEQEYDANNGLLQCIDGGYVRCPSKRAMLNYKLQPDGAILMKQALVIADKLLKEAKLDYMFVLNVHDEVQLDCAMEHAHRVGELCCKAMTLAGELLGFTVPITGEFKVGFNWQETH